MLHLGGSSSSVDLKDIVMYISLSRNQDLVSRLYHHLIVSPLFMYPLPSLISNCLNPPFGTQGRSRRLKEAYILQIRNGEHTANLYSRVATPQSPAQFLFREQGNYDCDNFLPKWGTGLPQLGEETLNWKYS